MWHAFNPIPAGLVDALHLMRWLHTLWVRPLGTDHSVHRTPIVVERQLEAQSRAAHELGPQENIGSRSPGVE